MNDLKDFKEMHIKMVKVLFYWQNSHENVLWKVYSSDLNFVIELEVQGWTHLGKQSLSVERQVKLKWED